MIEWYHLICLQFYTGLIFFIHGIDTFPFTYITINNYLTHGILANQFSGKPILISDT